MYYLKKKKIEDHTGIDSYVFNLINSEDHFWFPLGKSLSIVQLHAEEDSVEDSMKEVFKNVRNVISRNEKIVAKMEKTHSA